MLHNQVVSRDEWLAARLQHLAREKELTRLRDRLSAERRELPWVKMEKEYVFDTPDGEKTLADLFVVRARRRYHARHLQPARYRAEGAQRDRPQPQPDRLGAPPRPLRRGRLRRPDRAVRSAQGNGALLRFEVSAASGAGRRPGGQ